MQVPEVKAKLAIQGLYPVGMPRLTPLGFASCVWITSRSARLIAAISISGTGIVRAGCHQPFCGFGDELSLHVEPSFSPGRPGRSTDPAAALACLWVAFAVVAPSLQVASKADAA
jgi:hypothetical protein